MVAVGVSKIKRNSQHGKKDITKCGLTDDASGSFFFLCVMVVCKPTQCTSPHAVMGLHKSAQAWSNVSNVKADQQKRRGKPSIVRNSLRWKRP